MATKNTQTNNTKLTLNNQPAPKQLAKTVNKNPGTEAVDRAFDGVIEYCKNDPKTAKRIGGSVMLCTGIGIAVGGGLMIASSF